MQLQRRWVFSRLKLCHLLAGRFKMHLDSDGTLGVYSAGFRRAWDGTESSNWPSKKRSAAASNFGKAYTGTKGDRDRVFLYTCHVSDPEDVPWYASWSGTLSSLGDRSTETQCTDNESVRLSPLIESRFTHQSKMMSIPYARKKPKIAGT